MKYLKSRRIGTSLDFHLIQRKKETNFDDGVVFVFFFFVSCLDDVFLEGYLGLIGTHVRTYRNNSHGETDHLRGARKERKKNRTHEVEAQVNDSEYNEQNKGKNKKKREE